MFISRLLWVLGRTNSAFVREKKYMVETINVLVDLAGLGIVDLPISYTLRNDDDQPHIYLADCKILLSGKNLPEWLLTTAFTITYTPTTDENVSMISLCSHHDNTNRYYEMMLSIVSSYIQIKEAAKALKRQMAFAK
jgi:hypothetical protein